MEVEMEVPRYTCIFDEQINSETVQALIDNLIMYPAVDLFLSTPGGEMSSMHALIHFINGHNDINIYLTDIVASAGTFLLVECDKPIYFTEGLEVLLFHMGDRPIEGAFRKRKIDEKELYNQLKETNEQYAKKFTRLGLNKKEIKSYLDGDDVILYRKDFPRLKINQK